jgi:hypothetical protein
VLGNVLITCPVGVDRVEAWCLVALAAGSSITPKRCFQALWTKKRLSRLIAIYHFVGEGVYPADEGQARRASRCVLCGNFESLFWPFPVSLPFGELNSRFEW